MSLYRLYIDEVGNHDMIHADNPNEQFLSLTGVIIESTYCKNVLIPEFTEIKRKFFINDPDESVIFHRKDMMNKRPPFQSLRDLQVEKEFNSTLLKSLENWDYHVITVVIDKLAHREKYLTWTYHPYHYCLSVMMERFVLFLQNEIATGDVMVESRGGNEDKKLIDSFERLYHNGTDNISCETWQSRLTSKTLKVKQKSADICGLQLADLIAHASRREILLDHRLLTDNRDVFGDRISNILGNSKYLRNKRSGKMEGYGKKLLP